MVGVAGLVNSQAKRDEVSLIFASVLVLSFSPCFVTPI